MTGEDFTSVPTTPDQEIWLTPCAGNYALGRARGHVAKWALAAEGVDVLPVFYTLEALQRMFQDQEVKMGGSDGICPECIRDVWEKDWPLSHHE
jgi:hypothetical protein